MTPRSITGLGICSTIGTGREAFFRALADAPALAGAELKPVLSFDASKYSEAAVAEVADFDPARWLGDKGLRSLDRLTKLLVVAARLCAHDAGLKRDGAFVVGSPEQTGLVCSNAYGSLEAITELDRVAVLEDARYINPAKFPNTVANSASGYVSIWEDLRALNVAISNGNCGALDAVACADIYMASHRAETILVGGAEALSEALFLAFQRVGMLESGARVGEGAAIVALEDRERARARGARVWAEVVGCGAAFDAAEGEGAGVFHASKEAMARAIHEALADADVAASEVDLVISGVAGLRAFDAFELAGIARALGKGTPVCAPKRLLGETFGAGGAMGMAVAAAYLGGLPPREIVQGLPPSRVATVVVTAMGYYGNASAVVMRKSPD